MVGGCLCFLFTLTPRNKMYELLLIADGEYVEHSTGHIERHGDGIHYSMDGMVYSGKWENDKMNGEGKK